MLKAIKVAIRTDGGLDGGYVDADATGDVKISIDSFDLKVIADGDDGADNTELAANGIIVASLLPQVHIIGIEVMSDFSLSSTARIGTKNQNDCFLNGDLKTTPMKVNVSTKSLGELAAHSTSGFNKGINTDGLVDIILKVADQTDRVGTVVVHIYYI